MLRGKEEALGVSVITPRKKNSIKSNKGRDWRHGTAAGVLVSVIGAEVTGVVGHSYPASTEK